MSLIRTKHHSATYKSNASIGDLPFHLICNILLQLDPVSLATCFSVSKLFHDTKLDPEINNYFKNKIKSDFRKHPAVDADSFYNEYKTAYKKFFQQNNSSIKPHMKSLLRYSLKNDIKGALLCIDKEYDWEVDYLTTEYNGYPYIYWLRYQKHILRALYNELYSLMSFNSTKVHLAFICNQSVALQKHLGIRSGQTKKPELPHEFFLHLACLLGYKEVVDILLLCNVNINKKNARELTPLSIAFQESQFDIAARLINQGADITIAYPDREKNGLIHRAVMDDDLQWIILFSDAIDLINAKGETPLITSINHRKLAAFELLLRLNANLNLANVDGDTPLHIAVENEAVEFVNRLLCHRGQHATVTDCQNTANETPLTRALALKNKEIVKLLLDHGANPTLQTGEETPLHFALKNENSDLDLDLDLDLACIEMLLANSQTDIFTKNKENKTALSQAYLKLQPNLIELLLKPYGLSVPIKKRNDHSPQTFFDEKMFSEYRRECRKSISDRYLITCHDLDACIKQDFIVETEAARLTTFIQYLLSLNFKFSDHARLVMLCLITRALEDSTFKNRTALNHCIHTLLRDTHTNTWQSIVLNSHYQSDYLKLLCRLIGHSTFSSDELVTVINQLIKNGYPVNHATGNDEPPLIVALQKNNIAVVMHLIALNCNVNLTKSGGPSALILAIRMNLPSVVSSLLQHGADVYYEDSNKSCAIDEAAIQENGDLLAKLIPQVNPLKLPRDTGSAKIRFGLFSFAAKQVDAEGWKHRPGAALNGNNPS